MAGRPQGGSSTTTERVRVPRNGLVDLFCGVREGLGESGYQKLKAAIRTLGYLTELLRGCANERSPWRACYSGKARALNLYCPETIRRTSLRRTKRCTGW
jgi:hypothetical protein